MAFNVIQEQVNTGDLEDTVKAHLQTVLSAITRKINAVVAESEQVHANVEFDWSKLITTTFDSDNGNGSVPLSARGDGFRRITMMAYFEYLAEQRSSEIQNVIFGFEEPETFLHPSAQENLFEKLSDIAVAGYQVFLTTHSPVIVSKTQKSDLHRVYKVAGAYTCDSSVNDHSGIASDLGITIDNQFIPLFDNTKCFLLLEGIDDCVAFEHLANTYKDNGIVEKNFADLGVVTIPVGGCGSVAADEVWRIARSSLATLTDIYSLIYTFVSTPRNVLNTSTACPLSYRYFHFFDDTPVSNVNDYVVFIL